MRIEIHLDDAPEIGTEAVRKAVGIEGRDETRTRAVIYYEQPESVVEVSVEVFDHHVDGFVSIERFQSLAQPGKILSLSFWRDEAALIRWRQHEAHHRAQWQGRGGVFADYRLRVASVVRDYGMFDRAQAPQQFPDAKR